MKIYQSEKINPAPNLAAGEWLTDQKTFLHFAGIDGYIAILELQLEGKKKMSAGDFLKGFRLIPGNQFENSR